MSNPIQRKIDNYLTAGMNRVNDFTERQPESPMRSAAEIAAITGITVLGSYAVFDTFRDAANDLIIWTLENSRGGRNEGSLPDGVSGAHIMPNELMHSLGGMPLDGVEQSMLLHDSTNGRVS